MILRAIFAALLLASATAYACAAEPSDHPTQTEKAPPLAPNSTPGGTDMDPVIWLVIWACIPGFDNSCKWFDSPMLDIKPVTVNSDAGNVQVLDPKRCLAASMGEQYEIIAHDGGKKRVIEQVGCIVMYEGHRPGVEEHQLRGRRHHEAAQH